MRMDQKYIKDEKMSVQEVEQLITLLMKSVIENDKYFYHSTVDYRYSKLTLKGLEYLRKTLDHFLPLLADAMEEDLDARARATVFNTLKETRKEFEDGQ